MRFRVMPGAGEGGTGQPLSSYVIGGRLAVDAGALGYCDTVAEQSRITDIVLTHSHIDHVSGLTSLIDNVYGLGERCPTVHASQDTLNCLRTDLFNDRLYPNMLAMAERMPPFLHLRELRPRHTVMIAGFQVTPIPVDHVVPCLAFVVADEASSVAVVTDTAPTDEIWQHLHKTDRLRAIFLECSFPDHLRAVAESSKHLTVSLFAAEVAKAPPDVPVFAIHVKPRFADEIAQGLRALRDKRVAVAVPGRTYRFKGD